MRIRNVAPFLVAVLSTTASLLGCSTGERSNTGLDESPHTAGEITTLNDPHVWAQVSEAELAKVLRATPLRQTDPLAQRLQQWLDRYHGIVTALLAERGEHLSAPKPVTGLVRATMPNGWVTGTVACPGWTLTRTSAMPSSGATPPNLFLQANSVLATNVGAVCVRPQNWTDAEAFAAYWNRQTPACTLSASGSSLTAAGDGCKQVGASPQGSFATRAIASVIGVTLDAISWGDETSVAMTLAHELGHYYRAHPNPVARPRMDFFYTDENDDPVRPVPLADSQAAENVVQAIKSSPAPLPLSVTTRFNKRLGTVVLGLRGTCPSTALGDSTLRAIALGMATAAEQDEYLTLENAIDACTQQLSLTDPQLKANFDSFLVQAQVNPGLAEGAPTIAAALAQMTVKFDALDAAEASLIEQMTAGSLGWYTDEQEADDLGLELTARAGIAPKDVIDARVRNYERKEAFLRQVGAPSTEKVDMATCKRWLDADFTETGSDGVARRIRVPVGSLSEPHHDSCYRIYNLWREAKRHAYPVAAAPAPFGPAWATIQSLALAAGASPAPTL